MILLAAETKVERLSGLFSVAYLFFLSPKNLSMHHVQRFSGP